MTRATGAVRERTIHWGITDAACGPRDVKSATTTRGDVTCLRCRALIRMYETRQTQRDKQ